MNKIIAWLRIVRPPIMLISMLGSAAVLILSDPDVQWRTLKLVLMTSGLLAAGLMIQNDIFDLASDRVRRSNKALCSGAISVRQARIAGYIFMSFAGGLAILLAWPALLYVWSVLAVGAWYNRRGKHCHIWGNAATAYGVGGIILFPMLVSGDFRLWSLWLGISIQEIGREIMVGIGDVEGDKSAGWRTLPVLVGRGKAHQVAGIFYALGIPLFLFQPGIGFIYYFGAVIFAAILIFGWLDTREKMVIADVRVDPGFDKAGFIFKAFERDLRLWSRLGVLIFQLCILLAAIAG